MKVLALCAVIVSAVPGCATRQPASAVARTSTLVVLNKSERSASLIDPATGVTLAKLPVGRGPHELAVSADGRTAYVANFGRFGVYPAGDTTHTLAGNGRPISRAVTSWRRLRTRKRST